jgi:hypothetical protein
MFSASATLLRQAEPEFSSSDIPPLTSGFGQLHTNEPDPAKPRKRLIPYKRIDWAGILLLVDNPQRVDKEVGRWLIPSSLPSRTFKTQFDHGEFWLLWADFDPGNPAASVIAQAIAGITGGPQCEVYSSRSSTEAVPRTRALIPLGRPLTGADWSMAQEVLNDLLVDAGLVPDRATERPAQLCYLPNRGVFYETCSQRKGHLFDPVVAWVDLISAKRKAVADAEQALLAERQAAAVRKAAQPAPTSAAGRPTLIDAFNAVHHVADILLQEGYAQRGSSFRHPASESGSFSASVKDGRVHSLSSADPLYTNGGGGGAHDAFSTFCVLKHGGDQKAALKDAGDNWLTIGAESWNRVEQREWAQANSQPLFGGAQATAAGVGLEVADDGPAQELEVPDWLEDAPPPEEVATVLPDGMIDFYAHLPSHHYLFVPTRELWPVASVNGKLTWPKVGKADKPIAPAAWLDKHRAVEQLAWHPAEQTIITDRVLQVSGWARHDGAKVFNLYRAPDRPSGDASQAGPWLDHLHRVYPDDAEHIIRWLAHRVQQPGDKCNHALVLGGLQGIGKDTLLEPLKAAIGPWNWSDISPVQMIGRFNGWAKAVVVRVNEGRDLGDVDRFAFYDHSKVIIAAPPDVIRVDEKHLRETYVINCCGVIITTNHASDGLYLPADDRRHYVAWSPRKREDFADDYWRTIYGWFAAGGTGHVSSYLTQFDLSGFDPKAPPLKTPAFWAIVAAGEAPESGELRDVLEGMNHPRATSMTAIVAHANAMKMFSLADELDDRKNRRTLPHKLERVGYVAVRNPDSTDGLFSLSGRRQRVYALRELPLAEQVRAARRST